MESASHSSIGLTPDGGQSIAAQKADPTHKGDADPKSDGHSVNPVSDSQQDSKDFSASSNAVSVPSVTSCPPMPERSSTRHSPAPASKNAQEKLPEIDSIDFWDMADIAWNEYKDSEDFEEYVP